MEIPQHGGRLQPFHGVGGIQGWRCVKVLVRDLRIEDGKGCLECIQMLRPIPTQDAGQRSVPLVELRSQIAN